LVLFVSFSEGIAEMYRKLFAIVLLSLFAVATVGCATKELKPDENAEFKADTTAATKGMQESMEKGGMKMRPEAMEQMQKMQDSMKNGTPAKKPGS